MIVAEGRQSGGVEQVEEELIYKVFDFADKEAHDVMVHAPGGRDDLGRPACSGCLDAIVDSPSAPLSGVSRLSVDEIVGILHVRDLFKALYDRGIDSVQIEELLRPPYFVPETKDLAALLAEFRRTSQHMAIVVDEYGAMEGIVTLSCSRGDRRRDRRRVRPPGRVPDADRRPHRARRQDVSYRRLQRAVQDRAAAEDYHTLAGFVFGALGRAPEQDDEVQWNGLRFRVVEVDGARIEQLDVEVPAPGTASRRRGRNVVEPVGFAGEAAPSQWPRPRGAPRPELLDLGVETLPRVGPSLAARPARTIRDLLEHRPHRYEEPVPERPSRTSSPRRR